MLPNCTVYRAFNLTANMPLEQQAGRRREVVGLGRVQKKQEQVERQTTALHFGNAAFYLILNIL